MQIAQLILHNFFSFIAIISIIVFIHEFGHFWVARLCGVKIDAFSLGFGKEIFGYNDKHSTRWKLCILPLGGYVKMYGDKNGASMPDLAEIAKMTDEEKQKSFICKTVYQRFAIVIAGPVANFLLAIAIFIFLFKFNGLNTVLPIVDTVLENGAAFESGLKKGDKILQINEVEITDFNQMRQIVSTNPDKKLQFKIERKIVEKPRSSKHRSKQQNQDVTAQNVEILALEITPKFQDNEDLFGNKIKVGMLGITASEVVSQELNLWQAAQQSVVETYKTSWAVLQAFGELITGKRSVDELGGPIKIAQYSGKTVSMGVSVVLWFMAMISINLGVMNLLPVPVLDGGHLFYYLIEIIYRKPLSQKVQQIGFQVGMSLVLALMIFTTYNDVRQLFF